MGQRLRATAGFAQSLRTPCRLRRGTHPPRTHCTPRCGGPPHAPALGRARGAARGASGGERVARCEADEPAKAAAARAGSRDSSRAQRRAAGALRDMCAAARGAETSTSPAPYVPFALFLALSLRASGRAGGKRWARETKDGGTAGKVHAHSEREEGGGGHLRERRGEDAALHLVVVALGPDEALPEDVRHWRPERRRLHCGARGRTGCQRSSASACLVRTAVGGPERNPPRSSSPAPLLPRELVARGGF